VPGAGAGAGDTAAPVPPAEHVRGLVAHVLRLAGASLDEQRPLLDLGLDSMMAIDLKSRLEAHFGVPLSLVRLLQAGTLADLAEAVATQVAAVRGGGGGHDAPAATRSPPAAAAADTTHWVVDQLSDHDVDALLREMGDEETDDA
jgi:acyl carrier protein